MFGWWKQLPPGLFLRRDQAGFERMKTQATSLLEQVINDGFALSTEWLESAIPAGGSLYAEITVPEGFYLGVPFKEINTEKEKIFYRAYGEDDYTVSGTVANDASNYIRYSNLNSKSTLTGLVVNRVTVAAPPDTTLSIPGATAIAWGVPSSASGNRSSGDVGVDSVFRLLGDGTQKSFLLQLTNNGASISACHYIAVLVLLPEQVVSNPLSG